MTAAAAAAPMSMGNPLAFSGRNIIIQPPLQTFRKKQNKRSALQLGLFDDDDKTTINERIQYKRQHKRNKSVLQSLAVTTTGMISLIGSLGTLWSEYSVILTGCGPPQLADVFERGCYLSTLGLAGLSVFLRIITGEGIGSNNKLLRTAETMSLFAAFAAFVVLGAQEYKGEQMDGLSGINVDMCRALQELD
jgi:hypothetical protein